MSMKASVANVILAGCPADGLRLRRDVAPAVLGAEQPETTEVVQDAQAALIESNSQMIRLDSFVSITDAFLAGEDEFEHHDDFEAIISLAVNRLNVENPLTLQRGEPVQGRSRMQVQLVAGGQEQQGPPGSRVSQNQQGGAQAAEQRLNEVAEQCHLLEAVKPQGNGNVDKYSPKVDNWTAELYWKDEKIEKICVTHAGSLVMTLEFEYDAEAWKTSKVTLSGTPEVAPVTAYVDMERNERSNLGSQPKFEHRTHVRLGFDPKKKALYLAWERPSEKTDYKGNPEWRGIRFQFIRENGTMESVASKLEDAKSNAIKVLQGMNLLFEKDVSQEIEELEKKDQRSDAEQNTLDKLKKSTEMIHGREKKVSVWWGEQYKYFPYQHSAHK